MNNFFDNFYNYAGFGPAIKQRKPSAESLSFFKGKLPERLIEYWQSYGFCGWGNGIFWLVDPADYNDILKSWIHGTEFEERERKGLDKYYVIGRSAFGRLFVWGESSGLSLKINPLYGMLLPSDNTDNLNTRGADRIIDLFFASMSKAHMEEEDLDDLPLFERALNKLGALEADEMYTFVPALALGGANKLENLQKVKVFEQHNFLSELGGKNVMSDIVMQLRHL